MSTTSRTLALHGAGLVLALPLFFFWLRSPDGSITGLQISGLLAAATVYGLIAVLARPKSVYDGAEKIGLMSRSFRLLLLAVAAAMISVPILDMEDQLAQIFGLGTLMVSAIFYALAFKSAVFIKE